MTMLQVHRKKHKSQQNSFELELLSAKNVVMLRGFRKLATSE